MTTTRGPISSLMTAVHAPIYRSRLRELVRRIVPHLAPDDRVLDVGCGVGTLGSALLRAPGSPQGLVVEGLERVRRGGEPITVHTYQGGAIPFQDNAYDVVIVADVLHHEQQPDRLLDECIRVARRLLIVKDHQVRGPLAHPRISLIDWAANAPHGVPCLYRYNTPDQWRRSWADRGLRVVDQASTINLYPPLVNLLFGRRLQYMAFVETAGERTTAPPDAVPTA